VSACPPPSSLSTSSSFQLVTSEYSKLEAALEDLGISIGNTLDRQKHDLERTHKIETDKLRAEIENLINEKQFLEDSSSSNEKTSQLETERDWYKKEALHLDEVLEQSKANQKKLTDLLFESEQDTKLTKRQVGKLTKRSRTLEKKLQELGVDVNTLSEDGIYIEPEIEEPNKYVAEQM
jgi:hypothetical protein